MTAAPRPPGPACVEPEIVPERRLSIIVPVYGNAATIPRLCEQLASIELPDGVRSEVVFVVDGSPDRSAEVLDSCLGTWSLPARLVILSRNFGSFAAIRAGLEHSDGDYFAVISADLQEPPALIPQFVEVLHTGNVDLVLGRREGRADPLGSRLSAGVFWRMYRRWVQPSMPLGGVDVFGCNAAVRASILELEEANSSLVGQLLWVGFRRTTVGYQRLARTDGGSGWTLAKKFRYLSDSIFSFTDLPIRFLLIVGMLGSLIVTLAGVVVGAAWAFNDTNVPGYTPIMLAVLLVGFVVILALGIVGSYVWRTYENTKHRPLTIVQSVRDFPGSPHG